MALDIQANGALLRAPGNTQRPNLTGDSDILGDVGGGKLWFDTSVFALPRREHVRQPDAQRRRHQRPGLRQPRRLARQALRHRHRSSPSSASTRSTSPTRCTRNNPNATFGNATFGQITGAYGERLVRFGLRFVF